jgi:CRP/FNR family transcriptional regulator, cyclic AMP receptor protein
MFRYSAAHVPAGPDTFYGMLSEAARDLMSSSSRETHYRSGARMFYEGAPAAHVYVLIRGITKSIVTATSGQTAVLRVYGSGDVMGSEAFLANHSYSEAVIALSDCTCWSINANRFSALLTADPIISRAFSVAMAQRAQAADERTKSRLAPPPERLARVLLDLAERIGTETPDGIGIPVELSQEELASWIDVSRSTIARMLADLRHRGQIQTSYRHITITDLQGLRSTANPSPYSDLLRRLNT